MQVSALRAQAPHRAEAGQRHAAHPRANPRPGECCAPAPHPHQCGKNQRGCVLLALLSSNPPQGAVRHQTSQANRRHSSTSIDSIRRPFFPRESDPPTRRVCTAGQARWGLPRWTRQPQTSVRLVRHSAELRVAGLPIQEGHSTSGTYTLRKRAAHTGGARTAFPKRTRSILCWHITPSTLLQLLGLRHRRSQRSYQLGSFVCRSERALI